MFGILLNAKHARKNFSRRHFEIFFIKTQKIRFDKSPKETICMKCQTLCFGKSVKKNINLSSAVIGNG